MLELVLYGIRLLAKKFLGAVLDTEVDQSGFNRLETTRTEKTPAEERRGANYLLCSRYSFVVNFNSETFNSERGFDVFPSVNPREIQIKSDFSVE